MKKLLAMMLALCMVFALCACGAEKAEEAPAAEAPAAEAPAAEAPAEEAAWAPDGPVTMIVSYKAGNGTDV
ncbi:MAG: tripartite tricarboxylate transporter substrate binding protein, partial [Ruminococcaceae bacterium]|nr:tripartite tricarboxylate transporter substrate binding protein [Oscillospiraceae bacterium]